MKLLKIENNKGYYLLNINDKYDSLDKITKDDLLWLVDQALEGDVELDEFVEDHLKNEAHQIIYKSVYAKLKSLNAVRDKFKDECERLYLSEYERYRVDST